MEDFEKFYNSSLRFLSYRPRSEKEVRDKLKSLMIRHSGEEGRRLQNLLAIEKNGRDSGHGQNDEIDFIIEKIVAKLKDKKFINDEEFAKGWIESRLRFKPRSLRLIKIELKQKGIDDKIINNLQLTINDLAQAKKLVEKRIERIKDLPRQEIYQKLGRYLAAKGFGWDTIKKSIDEALIKGV